jgi:hypothetical protein
VPAADQPAKIADCLPELPLRIVWLRVVQYDELHGQPESSSAARAFRKRRQDYICQVMNDRLPPRLLRHLEHSYDHGLHFQSYRFIIPHQSVTNLEIAITAGISRASHRRIRYARSPSDLREWRQAVAGVPPN